MTKFSLELGSERGRRETGKMALRHKLDESCIAQMDFGSGTVGGGGTLAVATALNE